MRRYFCQARLEVTLRIFTIGYEGATVDEFLAALQEARLERIIDVRAVPNSRRPGLSKTPKECARRARNRLCSPALAWNARRRPGCCTGLGLAYVFQDSVEAEVADGSLIAVLSEWTPPFAGYQLYYPSRRQQSPASAVLLEALGYRG